MGNRDKTESPAKPGDPAGASGNLLLARLPAEARVRLEAAAETVSLKARQVIHAQGKPLRFAVFPCGGLLSITMRANGKAVEVAMVGNEGFFGLPLFFGTSRCPMTAISQAPGRAVRVPAPAFAAAVRAGELAPVLGRYAQAFSAMIAQGAVCHGAHSVEQRCAKRLLLAHDRLQTNEFPLTQEFLAQMLGVRRPTVSATAMHMQRAGVIRYRQGRLTILDRAVLEERSCACYG